MSRDGVQKLRQRRLVDAGRTLLDSAQPQMYVPQQPSRGRRSERRAGLELECASDVVDQRRGQEKVTPETRVKMA
jgi:hypothetical protein